MENKITELEIQKKDKKRVSVFLDDKYAFALDIMAAASLCRGQKLSDEKINELKYKDQYNRALNSAVRFLGHRARSIKEMETYLAGKDYSNQTITIVIEQLLEKKYLNDNDFARMWIDNRAKFNPRGAWALRYELRNKGVDDNIIANALLEYDDNKAAWNAIQKKLSLWKNLKPEKFQNKVYTFLSSRGFNYETTADIYNRVIDIMDNE